MAGRPPKPTNLLELTGAFRKDPARRRKRGNEPQPPGPIGEPPAGFLIQEPATGYQRAAKLLKLWQESVSMWPWLTFSDRHSLARYCELALRFDEKTASESDKRLCQSMCSRMGGDGAGRAGLGQLGAMAAMASSPAPERIDARADFLRQKKLG